MTSLPAMTAVTPDPTGAKFNVVDTSTVNGDLNVVVVDDDADETSTPSSSSAETLLREVAWQIGFGSDKENIVTKDDESVTNEGKISQNDDEIDEKNKSKNHIKDNNQTLEEARRLNKICQRLKEEFLLED